MFLFNLITPCFNEHINTILENIKSVKNQSLKSKIHHICVFDGVDRLSEIPMNSKR